MKKWTLLLVVPLVAFGVVAYVSAQDAPKPEKGIIIGTAIELSTYAIMGLNAEGFSEAAATRAEQGFPVGILEDETHEVYVCVYRNTAPASHTQLANKQLTPYMGQKVVVQGLKYRADGINLVRMSVISEY